MSTLTRGDPLPGFFTNSLLVAGTGGPATIALSRTITGFLRNIKLPPIFAVGTKGQIGTAGAAIARSRRGSTPSGPAAAPKVSTAPRTTKDVISTGLKVTGAGILTGGAISLLGTATTPTTGAGTSPLQDLTKGVTDITENIAPTFEGVSNFLQANPTGILLIAGGIVLLLLIK